VDGGSWGTQNREPATIHHPPPTIGDRAMRDIIHLACGDCKRRNYSTTKNKKKTTERLEFNKFCRFCRKHTAHKETK
jgi:large subunit ribosomal protein L33